MRELVWIPEGRSLLSATQAPEHAPELPQWVLGSLPFLLQQVTSFQSRLISHRQAGEQREHVKSEGCSKSSELSSAAVTVLGNFP